MAGLIIPTVQQASPTPRAEVLPPALIAETGGPEPRARSTPRPSLPSLTGVRFVAAFIVVLFHAALPRLSGDGLGVRLLRGGYLGVSLFFVLSGFILAYTYLQADGRLRGSSRAFWRARFARVYPVYVLALCVAAPLFLKQHVLDAWGTDRIGSSVWAALLTPALLQSWWPAATCAWNCPGWSLSTEAFFYFVFPALGVWLAGRPRERVVSIGMLCWVAALATPVAYMVLQPDGVAVVSHRDEFFWISALKYNPLVHLGEFALGIACGIDFLHRARVGRPRKVRAVSAVALFGILAILVAGPSVPYPMLHSGLVAPLFAIIIYALARGEGGMAAWLSTRPMVKLGEASYALYLLHLPLIGVFLFAEKRLGLLGEHPLLVTVAAIVTSILASLVVFKYVEEPVRLRLRAPVSHAKSAQSSPTGASH